jgi:ATP-dependent helicase HrpA
VIAAISLARRVANEYDGASVGQSIGYRVGHSSVGEDKNRVPGTDIVFMTDGTFIQESQLDSQMSDVRVLIIDEAHERSLCTDIVIGIAKRLLNTRPNNFYVVISSATIDPARFLAFFQRTDAKPLIVQGRVYPVEVDYIPKLKDSIEQHAVSTILNLYNQHQGHSLVFLPGQREIENAMELFNRKKPNSCVVLPLYSALSPEEQDRVIQFDEGASGENRMIVFCTNIAETSLTIKNTRLVIDSGLANEAYFDHKNRLTVIETVRISQASADQRKGRAGRTAPEHCVRLYDEDELIRPNIKPEILRSSLDLVILQVIRLKLNPTEFLFMDPPDEALIQTSLDLLKDLSYIDTNHVITQRGELAAKLGLDPRYSAFLIDTYLEHSPILELTATIVAVLVAPAVPYFPLVVKQQMRKKALVNA